MKYILQSFEKLATWDNDSTRTLTPVPRMQIPSPSFAINIYTPCGRYKASALPILAPSAFLEESKTPNGSLQIFRLAVPHVQQQDGLRIGSRAYSKLTCGSNTNDITERLPAVASVTLYTVAVDWWQLLIDSSRT